MPSQKTYSKIQINPGETIMGYAEIPYDRRIKENIRNYTLINLYDMDIIKKYLNNLAEILELNLLFDRPPRGKGNCCGRQFRGFSPGCGQ